MTYAELFTQTLAAQRGEGRQGTKNMPAAFKKFLSLATLSADAECDDRLLTEDYIQQLRARAEADGALNKASSASWVSLMKPMLHTRRACLADMQGKSFTFLLREGLKKSGLRHTDAARAVGMPPTQLTSWASAGKFPADHMLPVIAKLDTLFKQDGKLTASLSYVTLRHMTRDNFTPEQKKSLRAGDGTLNALVRFWVVLGNQKFSGLFKEAKLRPAVWTRFNFTVNARYYLPLRLRPTDRPAFTVIDQKVGARGKILAAFDRELAAQKPVVKVGFLYAEWSQQLKDEFRALEEYKMDNPKGLERVERGKWTAVTHPSGRVICASRDGLVRILEALFGYALRSGIVKDPATLRLAHAALPEIIMGSIRERMTRMKRDHLVQADEVVIIHVMSLIYGGGNPEVPGYGYFANDEVGAEYWNDPFFAKLLPLEAEIVAPGGYRVQSGKMSIPAKDKRARWQAWLATVWKALSRFDRAQTYKKGNFAGRIQDILSNLDFDIGAWLDEGFTKLSAKARPKASSPVAWAQQVRLCVLYMMLTTRAFRRGTLLRLETKHIVLNKQSGKYHYAIPEPLFKTRGKGGSKGGVQAEIDDVLRRFEAVEFKQMPVGAHDLIRLYLNEARPLLTPDNDSFFVWNTKEGLHAGAKKMSREALGRQLSFHPFRYLIATWAKRRGIKVEDAADILGHLPRTTQATYDMTNAQDTGRRTNKSIKSLYEGENTAA
jgi:hypothetical protein